jgi:hypothetical protein
MPVEPRSTSKPAAKRLQLRTVAVDHSAMEPPEIRYAWNGDYALAYLLMGDGPVDLVYFHGYLSNVELNWEHL